MTETEQQRRIRVAREKHYFDWDLISAMVSVLHPYFLPMTEQKKQLRRAKRLHNIRETLRLLLGVFEWKYLLLPVGVRRTVNKYFGNGDLEVLVYARDFHIFGIRVARWVTHHEIVRDVVLTAPVPLRRYRRRVRNRK